MGFGAGRESPLDPRRRPFSKGLLLRSPLHASFHTGLSPEPQRKSLRNVTSGDQRAPTHPIL